MQGIYDSMGINSLAKGMDVASVKNGVIARNIANMDTPGYKAKDLKFFDVMGEVMGEGKKLPLARTNEKHLPLPGEVVDPSAYIYQQNNPSVRNDGNDVNVDYEMSQMAENSIRYNELADITSEQFTKLKDAISSGQ